MYDMNRVNDIGYFDALDKEQRYKLKETLNHQRIEDYKTDKYKLASGVVDPLPDDASVKTHLKN